MARLLHKIFQGEFVIDEPRETLAVIAVKKSQAIMPAAVDPSEAKEEKVQDLITQISEMLLEQERLEQVAHELSQRGNEASDAQLVRFFKHSLSVMDGFDYIILSAQRHPPSEEIQNWLKSVAGVQSRMSKLLEDFGLRTMDPVGKLVNLERHEVVEVINTESVPDETVVEVRQKGYLYKNRVLRDARVVVAKNERR